ncbi:ribonuclease H-like domain-containing protein [Tanacetum coccineum]
MGSTSGIRAFALRNFDLEVMEFESAHDYALWEVIKNGNSWESVPQTAQENGTSVTKMSVHVTAEEKTNKKNDVKAKSLLLMALPNEHQLTFSQYTDAKTMFATIETRFGGNEATKKTQKTLLKQQYENFSASSSESLDSIFNRLQKINTHVVVWMNKAEIETISIDDLYNNFKIVAQSVKKSVGASSGAQNLAFMTSPSTSSTNDVNTATPAYEQDLDQIHEDDLEAMDLKWQLSLLSMRAKRYYQRTGKKIFINANDTAGYDKSKVECLNCHKMGHFARECRAPRNKEGQFRNQDNTRKQGNNKDTSSKAILAIDGVGFDWSDMAEEQVQTNMALMAFSDSELNQTEFTAATYKRGLATVEEQLITYRKNEVLFSEEVAVLKREVACKDYEINVLKNDSKENSDESLVKEQVSKDTSSFVECSINVDKETVFPIDKKIECVKPKNHEKPAKKPVNTAHPKLAVPSAKSMSHFSKQAQLTAKRPFYKQTTLTRTFVHTAKRHYYTKRPRAVNTARSYTGQVNAVREKGGKPQQDDKGFVDSGCSRHMTGNIAYLLDFKEFDRGYVAFGGGAYGGRITGKGTLKTDSLDFEDVYFVNELKFNLFSVSQMCDKKNYVLFTDTECLVLSPNFKLPDENQILLKIPRKDNMYSFDMKNIVPKESLTCLVAKATLDESMLWHRRLVNTASSNDQDSPKDMFKLGASHTLEATHVEFFSDEDEPEVDLGNILNSYTVPTTPNTRIHRDHPIKNVIGDVNSSVQTRRMTKPTNEQGFLSAIKPTSIAKALFDSSWVEAMQEELLQLNSTVHSAKSMSHFSKQAQSTNQRPFDKKTTLTSRYVNQKLNTAMRHYHIERPRAVNTARLYTTPVNAVRANRGKLQQDDTGFIGSGCSRHMTGNIAYLSDFKEFDRGYVTFGGGAHGGRIFICACARFQVTPKTSHLLAVKRIFRYLKGKLTLGLWYSRDSPFELVAYTDDDYAGATQDRKSTTRVLEGNLEEDTSVRKAIALLRQAIGSSLGENTGTAKPESTNGDSVISCVGA